MTHEAESEQSKLKQSNLTKESKKIETLRVQGVRLLIGKNFQEANEVGVDALRQAVELYGKGSMFVVPYYLLLSSTNLGLGHYKQVEDFLALANWNIVKSGETQDEFRGQLSVLYGRLYTLHEKYEEGLHQIANGIYHLSVAFGPEDTKTSMGYFYLANAFHKMQATKNGLAMYDKVIDIWYKYFSNLREMPVSSDAPEDTTILEAVEMCKRILDVRIRSLGAEHIATGEARYTLGLFYLYLGDPSQAKQYLSAALELYREQLGDDHPSTQDVESVYSQLVEQ